MNCFTIFGIYKTVTYPGVKMILKHSLLWILFFSFSVMAQDWKTITTMNEVTDLTDSGTKIWASSTGGVFSYQPETEEI